MHKTNLQQHLLQNSLTMLLAAAMQQHFVAACPTHGFPQNSNLSSSHARTHMQSHSSPPHSLNLLSSSSKNKRTNTCVMHTD